MMQVITYPDKTNWPNLCSRPVMEVQNLEQRVSAIMEKVKTGGDSAVKEFCLQFDQYLPENLKVTEQEIVEAVEKCPTLLKEAIDAAYGNIKKFHTIQLPRQEQIEITEGITCWRKPVAIEAVGLYIPGGTAPLFSTVLMLAVPSMLAGCKNIVMCTPTDKNGKVNEAILYAAQKAGVKIIFKIGGVQAIAAMAYGTESVPAVFKIFGPGNQYVTCAKQIASRQGIAIDMPAGPSEVAILADDTCVPAFVAADLLSQAEHGTDSQVVLVTNSIQVVEAVKIEVEKQLATLPRKTIAEQALNNSRCIVVKDLDEGMEFLNTYAPEHLILACAEDEKYAQQVVNAGSVFLGNYTPESAGDYASGTNHTLPTNGNARAYSGVSVDSFYKKITFQKITKKGLSTLSNTIQTMALAEGLEAHSLAVKIRINNDGN